MERLRNKFLSPFYWLLLFLVFINSFTYSVGFPGLFLHILREFFYGHPITFGLPKGGVREKGETLLYNPGESLLRRYLEVQNVLEPQKVSSITRYWAYNSRRFFFPSKKGCPRGGFFASFPSSWCWENHHLPEGGGKRFLNTPGFSGGGK